MGYQSEKFAFGMRNGKHIIKEEPMIKIFRSSLPKIYASISQTSLYSTIMKIDDQFKNKTFLDRPLDTHLEEKALNLIFGERNYSDFAEEDKKIVDLYQEIILQIDGGVILPNTGIDAQQKQIQALLKDSF
jgi:hypothetical protein